MLCLWPSKAAPTHCHHFLAVSLIAHPFGRRADMYAYIHAQACNSLFLCILLPAYACVHPPSMHLMWSCAARRHSRTHSHSINSGSGSAHPRRLSGRPAIWSSGYLCSSQARPPARRPILSLHDCFFPSSPIPYHAVLEWFSSLLCSCISIQSFLFAHSFLRRCCCVAFLRLALPRAKHWRPPTHGVDRPSHQ